jgi:sulfatase maturation enzyme AslB (radical SAM superfamily)
MPCLIKSNLGPRIGIKRKEQFIKDLKGVTKALNDFLTKSLEIWIPDSPKDGDEHYTAYEIEKLRYDNEMRTINKKIVKSLFAIIEIEDINVQIKKLLELATKYSNLYNYKCYAATNHKIMMAEAEIE